MTFTNGKREPMNAQQQSGKSAQQRFDESKKQPGDTKTVSGFKNLAGQYVFNWYDEDHVLTKHIFLEPKQMYLLLLICAEHLAGDETVFKGIEWQE